MDVEWSGPRINDASFVFELIGDPYDFVLQLYSATEIHTYRGNFDYYDINQLNSSPIVTRCTPLSSPRAFCTFLSRLSSSSK